MHCTSLRLSESAQSSDPGEIERSSAAPDGFMDAKDRQTLHSFVFEHADRIGAHLLTSKASAATLWQDEPISPTKATGKPAWDNLTDAMCQLELQDDVLPYRGSASDQAVYGERAQLRTSFENERWSRLFYETARSQVLDSCTRDNTH